MPNIRITSRLSHTANMGVLGLFLLFAIVPGWATLPGQNGKIAFSANTNGSWQIYTINADGTDMVQITNLPSTGGADQDGVGQPAFSPDGTRIVFTFGTFDSNGNLHPDLYIVNADGSHLVRVTNDGISSAPRWSPDGKQIVFARTSKRTNVNTIVVMNADGSGTSVKLTSDSWDSYGPFYTPDGQQIVNYSQNGGLVAAVWIMHSEGTDLRRLTRAALEGFPSDVSPDGKHLLVGNHGNSPPVLSNDIFVMNLDGTKLKRLTHLSQTHHDVYGGYSPDGTKIVFASDRLSNEASLDLFVMNADGSNIQRIATGLTVGGCPSTNCVTPTWGSRDSETSAGSALKMDDLISAHDRAEIAVRLGLTRMRLQTPTRAQSHYAAYIPKASSAVSILASEEDSGLYLAYDLTYNRPCYYLGVCQSIPIVRHNKWITN